MPALLRRQWAIGNLELPQPVAPNNQAGQPQASSSNNVGSASSGNPSAASTSTPGITDNRTREELAKYYAEEFGPFSKWALFEAPLTPPRTKKRCTIPSPTAFDEEFGSDKYFRGARSKGYQVRRKPRGIVKAKPAKPLHTGSQWRMGPDHKLHMLATWTEVPKPRGGRDVFGEEMEILEKQREMETKLLEQFKDEDYDQDTDVEDDAEMEVDQPSPSKAPNQLGPQDTIVLDPQEADRIRLENQVQPAYPEEWLKRRTGILRAYTTELVIE